MSTFPPYFLFPLRFEAKQVPAGKSRLTPEFLDGKYELPAFWKFNPLVSKPDPKQARAKGGSPKPASLDFHFRFGWRRDGLFLTTLLGGKKRPVQVNSARTETSDSLSLMLDMRDVRVMHRATKFCHRFLFTPVDPASPIRGGKPGVEWLPIHRAKAHPNPVNTNRFETAYAAKPDGWALSVFMPGDTLTGYAPADYPVIGLSFTLFDNEFGWVSLQLPEYFPVAEDPSLWATVDLAE